MFIYICCRSGSGSRLVCLQEHEQALTKIRGERVSPIHRLCSTERAGSAAGHDFLHVGVPVKTTDLFV